VQGRQGGHHGASRLSPVQANEKAFGSHLVEGKDNSAASPRGKGEVAVMEKSFPTLVSQYVESDQGQKGCLTAVNMDAHTSCRNRVYEDNIPTPKLTASGRSPYIFERAARQPFVPLRRRMPSPEKGEILLLNLYCGAILAI